MEGDSKAPEFCIRIIISIHALRVEGDRFCYAGGWRKDISIHALRVEGDAQQEAQFTRQHNISIHALRVEGD